MTSDDDRLAEIRARCEAATRGPWSLVGGEIDRHPEVAALMVCSDGAGRDHVALVEAVEPRDGWTFNADFIARAREDVPWLLALADRLRAERDEARDLLRRCRAVLRARGGETGVDVLGRIAAMLGEDEDD